VVQSQPRQIVLETLSRKGLHEKKGSGWLVEWLKVKALSSSSSTTKKKKKKKARGMAYHLPGKHEAPSSDPKVLPPKTGYFNYRI
jgi:hypothetical protein